MGRTEKTVGLGVRLLRFPPPPSNPPRVVLVLCGLSRLFLRSTSRIPTYKGLGTREVRPYDLYSTHLLYTQVLASRPVVQGDQLLQY